MEKKEVDFELERIRRLVEMERKIGLWPGVAH